MRSFLRYLRQFRGSLVLAALFCCIFALTFWLYGLPVQAVLYPAALCAGIALAALAVDFRRVGQTLRQLEHIETAEELPPLPETGRLAEGEYQRIIRSLAQEQTTLRSEARRQYDDMVDYYTIWAHQIKTPMAAMELTLQNEDTPLSRRLRGELTRMEQYVEMVLVFCVLAPRARIMCCAPATWMLLSAPASGGFPGSSSGGGYSCTMSRCTRRC